MSTHEIAGRTDISEFHGVTNTISAENFYTLVAETCQQIYDVLVEHCGPHATDALIIQDTASYNLKDPFYSIFTKDGINIVRAIEFVSPLQKHIQQLVIYIGSRVDSLSHDGTTTAMMLFTGLVAQYFTYYNDQAARGAVADHRALRQNLLVTLRSLSVALKESVVTVDQLAADFNLTPTQALRYVAFQQAMLSSKGDRELSDAIVEVVETLPVELYGMFAVSQSGLETDRRFTVVRDEFDFMLPVVGNLNNMNHRMGQEYLAESCDLLVSEDDLIRGNPALEIVLRFMQLAEQDQLTSDLVIVTKSFDSQLEERVNTINRAHKHKIIVFPMSLYNAYSSRCTVLSAVLNVASVYPLCVHLIEPSLPFLIKGAKVHFKNKRLYLSNLYQKDGSAYHPSFTDRTRFIPYTQFVDMLKIDIDGFRSGRTRIESAADKHRYEDYVDIYRRTISAEVRNLQISGMRHDVLADRDVLQDAFGAVLASLEHGFVIDGYLKLYLAAGALVTSMATATIYQALYRLLQAVHKVAVRDSRFEHQVHQACIQSDAAATSTYLFYPVDGTMQWVNVADVDQQIVIQPADTYRELLLRLEDLLPKLLNTYRVIIPGTANTEAKS